ncbi:MAG: protein kinase domain-containing protein [Candidatus Sulfotelmatobacter sp.]
MAHVGQKVGRYRIEEEIGAGGMGVVYRAYDEKLERDVAVKVLASGTLADDSERKRFRNEARILSRLNHPCIQSIYDFETFDGEDFLITELVPGMSLDTRLQSGAMSENEALRMGLQLTEGLSAAHAAGVLHRDLKPGNLRVTANGRLKILDFGLATLSREEVLTLTTQTIAAELTGIAGTLPYMPPEQLLGKNVDQHSDIYSAGVVLFELATRRLPFDDKLVPKLTDAILHNKPAGVRKFAPKFSAEYERIVLKCIEKNPNLRYQSAKELETDLRRLALTISATAAAIPQRTPREVATAFGVVAACALLAAAVLMWLHFERASSSALPILRWEQLTNFNDGAEIPSISRDGKMVAFLRGPGNFGNSTDTGDIWVKSLTSGDVLQLTKSAARKQTIAFSPDGGRIYFTQIEGPFAWNTYEIPLLGQQQPELFMANATGLSWIDSNRLLFSAINAGIHMQLVTSNDGRSDERVIYAPADQMQGMVHRSALSPDGKWVLLVEMDSQWWSRCRLLPFDGSSTGHEVGADGSCTWAQWSPDGQWMYFTVDTRTSGLHVWRQQFPDGVPQQLTPSGASEEEGLAVMPDNKSFITTSGTQQSTVWLHDDNAGDRQLTSEGYSFLPMLTPDGKKLLCLRRASGSHSYFSGELWATEITTGVSDHLFSGLLLTHFSLSGDGKKIVFATDPGRPRSGVWIAWLDGTQAPRQLTFGGEYRAFFGKSGTIFYQSTDKPPEIMRMKEDGSDATTVSDLAIMQLQNVSPDGRWAIVGVTPPGGHGDKNAMVMAVPLEGGSPLTVCDMCSFGFCVTRYSVPLVSWSRDGKWLYVSLRPFPFGSAKTAVIPVTPGAAPLTFTKDFTSEADFAHLPGARVLAQDNVSPRASPADFVSTRRSAKANLFRIYLER